MANLKATGAVTHALWDKLVFNQIKEQFGGCIRILTTASAPMSAEIMDFLKICFCVDMLEGYGQTEGGIWFTKPGDRLTGHVGAPVHSVEYKLVDVPELDYLTTDIINGKLTPRVEIVVRGNAIFKGYYK